jgi:hypothetical protein
MHFIVMDHVFMGKLRNFFINICSEIEYNKNKKNLKFISDIQLKKKEFF